jgi:NAD(P)-dependent dehydrogenase (short-subunit alcohol dehydrogenase family)
MTTQNGKTVIVAGASRGFGRMASNALAQSGHTVYALMRETAGRKAAQVAEVATYAKEQGVDLRATELDVNTQAEQCFLIDRSNFTVRRNSCPSL